MSLLERRGLTIRNIKNLGNLGEHDVRTEIQFYEPRRDQYHSLVITMSKGEYDHLDHEFTTNDLGAAIELKKKVDSYE